MENQAKLAAITAAVMAYIKTEEEFLLARTGAPPLHTAPPPPAAIPRLWGLSGRQDAMQTRQLMQLRAFHGKACR
jgi:hypothetical protein